MPVQIIEASLTQAADPMPGADGRMRVGVEPGTKWLYSGGGYALLAGWVVILVLAVLALRQRRRSGSPAVS